MSTKQSTPQATVENNYIPYNHLNLSEPDAKDKSAGKYIYGNSVDNQLEALQQKRSRCLVEVKAAEARIITAPKLELSPDAGEIHLTYIAMEAFVLYASTSYSPDGDLESTGGLVREVPKGGVITELERKAHIQARNSVEVGLVGCKQRLAEADALIAHLPDQMEDRRDSIEEIVHGYYLVFNVDMSKEARDEFVQDIRQSRATRARKIMTPEGILVWCMPAEELYVEPNFDHLKLPEDAKSIWSYRQ